MSDGAINFEFTAGHGQFDGALKEMESRIKGTTSTIDSMFDATTENIRIQKEVVAALEEEYKRLKKEIDALPSGSKAQYSLKQEAARVKRELDAEIQALDNLKEAVESNRQSHDSLRGILTQVRDEMVRMEMSGKRNTAEYEALRAKSSELNAALKGVNAQMKALSNTQAVTRGLAEGLSGVAAGFSIAQGTAGLFASKNEDLQKIMLKVQSLMAITIGLQQIQNVLHKDSAFMLIVVARAQDVLTAATARLASALNISTVAAKRLIATLTLGLSVAIGTVIYLLDRYISKQKEIAAKQAEYSKMVADEAYKSISTIERLSAQYKSLGDDMDAKQKFIEASAKAFESLGENVTNVAQAERLLIDDKEQFKSALLEKAKAAAAYALAAEKVKQLILIERELENTPRKTTQFVASGNYGQVTSTTINNPVFVKLDEQRKKLITDINGLNQDGLKAEDTFNSIIDSLHQNIDSGMSESIKTLEDNISKLREKWREATSDSSRAEFMRQITEQEAKLKALKGEQDKTTVKDESFSSELDNRKKLYKEYFDWLNSNRKELQEAADVEFKTLLEGGRTFMAYLENLEKKLSGKSKLTDKQKDQLRAVRSYIASETSETLMDSFKADLEAAKTAMEDAVSYGKILQEKLSDVGKEKDSPLKAEKLKVLFDLIKQNEKDIAREAIETYNKAIEAAADFARKRLMIEKEFADEVKKLDKNTLGEDRYQEALAALEKMRKAKLETVKVDEIKSGEAFKQLSGNYANLSVKTAKEHLETLKEQLKELGKESEAYQTILELIEKINGLLAQQLGDGIKQASVYLNDLAGLAGVFDENLASGLRNISGIVDGAARILEGDYIGGTMKVLTGIFTMIGDAQKRAEEKAEEYRKNVLEKIKTTIDNINALLQEQIRLIDKLSGTDKIKVFSKTFIDLQREIERVLNLMNQLEVLRNVNGRVYKQSLDNLITTYNEMFGSGRERSYDREIIEQLIAANNATISNLNEQLLSGEIVGDDAEKLRLLIEQLKAAGQMYEDVLDNYNQYLTGTTSNAIADSIMSGFEEGKFAAKDFAGNFEELMRKAMLQAIKIKYLEKPLEEWYNTFAAYSEDGLTDEEIEELRAAYNRIVEAAGSAARDVDDIVGGAKQDDSMRGAIKGVTEETAGLLAGQINAIRINQAHALTLMDEQITSLTEIAGNTRYNRLLVDIKNLLQGNSSNGNNSNRATGGQ